MSAVIDPEQLLEFACVPGRRGVNVPHLRYCRPDGMEFAFAEKHSRGFLSKLARYTGMDEGNDRRIDLRAGDDVELRTVCRVGTPKTGSSAVLERPIGTTVGVILRGDGRFVFELPEGRRVGGVERASEELQGRPIVDAVDNKIGLVQVSMPGVPSAMDLLWDISWSNQVGIKGWSSPYTGVFVKLDAVPDAPLRSFVVAFPIALALGYGRDGDWDQVLPPTEG